MKHYWSPHLEKDELKSMGAINIIPAFYRGDSLIPEHLKTAENSYVVNHWAFQADESFLLFVKFRTGKTIVELSNRHYHSLLRGEHAKVGYRSKIGKAIQFCMYGYGYGFEV